MSGPPISEASPKLTSSLESAAGATPFASPISQTIEKSGQAHVRVSRFRSLDADKAMPIADTCGPLFTVSSPSAALQSSLENKLRAAMDPNGSLEFALTWRQQDMPSGPPICALRASGRHTIGPSYTSWPTPTLSMSQPGSEVSIGGRRPNGTHATMVDPSHRARDFWADFTTLERRRLKPGAQLLVDGFPTRLAQLYAFGNAIVPQVAAQFIIAAREALGAMSRRERYQGLDAFDRASQRPAHRPAKSENVHSSGRPSGNSAAAFLRRLRTARPDLHARVLAGEISAYAGMIEAGWRSRPRAALTASGPAERAVIAERPPAGSPAAPGSFTR